MKKIYLSIVLLSLFVYADDYDNEINSWKQKRVESLNRNWLSLIDLHWINKEQTTIGSENCDITVSVKRFPKKIGSLTKNGRKVFFQPNVDGVVCEQQAVKENMCIFEEGVIKKKLAYKSLLWFVTSRSGKLAVRVRDYENEDVGTMVEIPRFPTNKKWKLQAKYITFSQPKTIEITNILGMKSEDVVPGKIVFTVDEKQYSLEPVLSGQSLFIMFQDATTGKSTYQVGRYMSVNIPKNGESIVLDFNKAYNPPCAYTPYATCPMVPEQNRLPLTIDVGEKHSNHH